MPDRVVRDPVALDQALDGLVGVLALDTEFHAEHVYAPRLMLVQLRDERGQCLVIDPQAVPNLRPLGRALERHPLVVHAHAQDLLLLRRATGFTPGPGQVRDPQVLAGFCGLGYPRSLGDLVQEVLGEGLPPSNSLSDWSRRPLTDDQLRYATADVRWLHALVAALEARLGAPARGAWAQQATDELVLGALEGEPPEARWQRIGGAAVLGARGRAALAALVAWREQRARALDQPRWQIATDVVLLDLARRQPRSVQALGENRKLPRRLISQWGPELVELLEDLAKRPDAQVAERVYNRGGPLAAEAHLHAWALAVEAQQGIAAELVLPQDLRRALVARWLAGDDNPRIPGWRDAAFGDAVRDLLNGRFTLGFRPEFRQVPPEPGHEPGQG